MKPLFVLLAATFAGCGPAPITLGGDDPGTDPGPGTDTGGGENIGDTADTADAVDSADSGGDTAPETWPKDCDDLYDQGVIQAFDLTFSDAEWAAIQSDCSSGTQRYRPASFTSGDETVEAMVRLKGNWSWDCNKLQFVISFNEVDPDARFHGLRKLMLDAPWYDRTLLHERLAFPLFKSRGLPYSCVNNAALSINGEYYGVYANIERIDHEYLERNFEDPSGNLYQGGSELKTNEDVGDVSDLTQLQAAQTVDDLDAIVDLDEAVAEWAAEAMLPAMDNYWAGVEINYYIYDVPGRGFVWLPYDLDISFGDAAYTDGSLVWPDAVNADPIVYEHYGWRKEALFQKVLASPKWCARYVEELQAARNDYDPAAMAADVDTWNAQIADYVAADSRKPFRNSDHAAAVAALKVFLQDRADVVDEWLADGDHCPAKW